MLDKNVIDNQTKLREEISEIKQYLSLIEHEVNSSGHVERLSDAQIQTVWRKLKTAFNFVYSANYFWAKYTNDREFREKLVKTDKKLLWEAKK